MALENIPLNVKRLKEKLSKIYPDYNFDIPAPLDTECRMKNKCPVNKPTYYDNSGNYFCGVQVEIVTDLNSMKKDKRECGAYLVDLSIRKAEQKRRREQGGML